MEPVVEVVGNGTGHAAQAFGLLEPVILSLKSLLFHLRPLALGDVAKNPVGSREGSFFVKLRNGRDDNTPLFAAWSQDLKFIDVFLSPKPQRGLFLNRLVLFGANKLFQARPA